ncbi:hypothetical protein AFLA70_267g001641 [Aspergillus flavus AF70]|nr:hypothetical protein AFLA70_267g001641 [Aspergillus flavus AF70]
MYDYISNYYRPNSILMVTATPRCLMKFAENTPAAAFGRHIELASRVHELTLSVKYTR